MKWAIFYMLEYIVYLFISIEGGKGMITSLNIINIFLNNTMMWGCSFMSIGKARVFLS